MAVYYAVQDMESYWTNIQKKTVKADKRNSKNDPGTSFSNLSREIRLLRRLVSPKCIEKRTDVRLKLPRSFERLMLQMSNLECQQKDTVEDTDINVEMKKETRAKLHWQTSTTSSKHPRSFKKDAYRNDIRKQISTVNKSEYFGKVPLPRNHV